MNKNYLQFLSAQMLGFLIFGALISGCVTSTPKRAAYDTIFTIGVTVDQLMTGYGQAVKSGDVSIEDQQKVKKIYEEYRKNYLKIVDILSLDIDSPAPENLIAIVTELTLLIGGLLEND